MEALEGEIVRPTAPGPGKRVFRTVVQVLLAVAGAIPAAAALLPISAAQSAWAVGFCGAFVLIASAAQNAYDESRGEAGEVTLADVLVILAAAVIVYLVLEFVIFDGDTAGAVTSSVVLLR